MTSSNRGARTDPEIFNSTDFITIQDDKHFFPIHYPGPPELRFLERKLPALTNALNELENIMDESEMAFLLEQANIIWRNTSDKDSRGKQVESIVEEFLIKKGRL